MDKPTQFAYGFFIILPVTATECAAEDEVFALDLEIFQCFGISLKSDQRPAEIQQSGQISSGMLLAKEWKQHKPEGIP